LRKLNRIYIVLAEEIPMNVRKAVLGSVLGLGLAAGGVIVGHESAAQNINPARHPNLAAAQRLCDQAYAKVSAAQDANEFDLDGHAAKAKDLLSQANQELKAAAAASNRNR
jgi:hypothetical protein